MKGTWDAIRQCWAYKALRLYQTGTDGSWSVSDHEMWLPGLYDAQDTAIQAAALPDATLLRLEPICRVDGENRPITMADLLAEQR
jgi:hypothetical protein